MLEALVALALVATAFIPLLILQSRIAGTVAAMERAELTHQYETSVINFAENLNPMMRPEGEERVGDGTLTWTSQPLGEAVRTQGRGGGGRFDVQLFDVTFILRLSDSRQRRWTVRCMGWRPIAPMGDF